MREMDPAWRNRDLPPSPLHTTEYQKITSWIDRGGDINETRMTKRGHTFLMQACIQNNETLVAELLKRGASTDIYAQGKTALHFACLLGHSNAAALLLQYKADTNLRVAIDDSDYTECDGMTPLEIVEHKMELARDPLRERYADLKAQLANAAAGLPIQLTSPVWTGLVGSSAPPAKDMSTESFDDGRGM